LLASEYCLLERANGMRLPPRMAARRGLGVDKTDLLSVTVREWATSDVVARRTLLNCVQDNLGITYPSHNGG
jgi:hypothetical protein